MIILLILKLQPEKFSTYKKSLDNLENISM